MKYKPTHIISFVNIELLSSKWDLIGPSHFFFERHVLIKPNLPMDLWFLELMSDQGSQALRIVAFCIETFPYPNFAKCTISKVVGISMTSNQNSHIIFITISKSPLPHTHNMILIISKKKVMILSY
jgi:hypothetical protein